MDRGTEKLIDRSKEKWKPDIRAIRAVIQFMKATQAKSQTMEMKAAMPDINTRTIERFCNFKQTSSTNRIGQCTHRILPNLSKFPFTTVLSAHSLK